MAEEINLGRLVAEIALDNQVLTDSAEEAIETIKNIEETVEKTKPEIALEINADNIDSAVEKIEKTKPEVNITVNGTESISEAIEKIPTDPMTVDVVVSVSGAQEAINLINSISANPISISLDNPPVVDENIISSLREQAEQATTLLQNVVDVTENYHQSREESSENTKVTTEGLTKTILEQEEKLKELKRQYSDTVLSQGKNSEQAQKLAKDISSLSNDISANNKKLKEAAYNADDYADALNNSTEASEEQRKANENLKEGFTVVKGVVTDLTSNTLQAAIDKFKELMTSGNKALNSIQAQTGMTDTEMSKFKEQMYELYSENYGESLEDVANVIAVVNENIDETDPEKIKEISKNAIAMSNTFGSDVEETLRGVNGLMTNMGLTADEAFDYIAKGSQNGLNKTNKLSDNLAEYTQIWGQAGFSAKEMFTILQNGLDSGAYSLDMVNSFVQEFAYSLADGRIEENIASFSTETENVFNAWKNGNATQADVFKSVINDLSAMTNQQEALTLASNVWSSMGEDNAMSVITSLNNVNDTYSNVQGIMQSINEIKYDDIQNQISTIGRQAEVEIIQPIIEEATPHTKELISWVSDHLPEVSGTLAGLVTSIVTFKAVSAGGQFLRDLITSVRTLTSANKAATASTTALNTTMKANPAVFLASTIISLVAGILAYNTVTDLAIDKTSDFEDALSNAESTAKNTVLTAEAEAKTVQDLADRYEELRIKTNKSAEEQEKLDTIAAQLAKTLGMTTDEIKDQSGAYKNLTGDVEIYNKRLLNSAKIQAYQQQLVEVNKQLLQYEEIYNALKGKDNGSFSMDSQKMFDDIFHSNDGTFEGTLATIPNFIKQYKEWQNKTDELGKKITELTGIQNENEKSTSSSTIVIEEEVSAAERLRTALAKLNYTEEELEEITKNAANAFDDMVSTQNILQDVTNEIAEKQFLSLDTLNNLVKKYPELTGVVNGYIKGIKTEQDVIRKLTEIYKNDVENYNNAIVTKAMADTELYNQFIQNSSDLINEYKDNYGIDLRNFKNAEQAKAAVVAAAEEQKRQEIAKTVEATAQTYIDSKSPELKRIGLEMQKSINNGTYNSWEIQQAGKNAAKTFDEAITSSSYYTEFYGGSYTPKNVTASLGTSDNNSGSSNEKTPLEKELEQLEHKKALGELTSKQEYDWLVKINNTYSMTADERMDMEEKIYNAKKQYEEELAQKQEENIQAEYDRIEKLAEQGTINTRQEIAQLEKIYQKYKLTTEQKITLEEKLAEKKKQLKDDEISALDTLGDAVVNALKNKYEQQKELEEKRIDESIESWQKWEDETCEAIQGQIDALDELKEAHDEENERQEYENKRQALELELAYEKDDYNRRQIEKEIAALDKEENERLFDLQIEQQKEALQEQMDSVKELSSEKQDALNKEKDSLSEKYDELTSDFAIQAEAQKVIINSSQKQLIDLINSYAPEYEMAGASLGEALYSGMTKKTSDISSYVNAIEKAVDAQTAKEKTQAVSELESYMASSNGRAAEVNNMSVANSSQAKSMQSSIDKLALSIDNLFNSLSSNATAYKNQMAVTANAAADRYYSTQQYYTTSSQSKVSSPTNVYMTVNFNDKVDSPIEVKRQLESVSEQLARQIASGY